MGEEAETVWVSCGVQKKVSDHNSGPSVWQFTLAVEHGIKMDAAEILQGKCAYADAKWVVMVGVSMHWSAHPLCWPWSHSHPQTAWWQTGIGSWQQLSCFVIGGTPIWSLYGHLGTAGESWAMPACTCHPAERWPGWLQVLQKEVQRWSCKPPVLQRTKYLFLFTSVQLPWIFLSLLHIPAG